MSGRSHLLRRTTLVVAALAAAGPLSGQVVVRTLQRDSLGVAHDNTFTMKVLRTGGQDSLLIRIDSVFRRLEREPMGSAERVQLEASIEQLMTRLTASVRWNGEVGVRIGGAVSEAFARAMVESGAARAQQVMPQGWIGIVADGALVHQYIRGSELIRYFSYPSIVSVEPNSPAERAGILAGDTLVAYDRADVRDREINLSRLLIPEKKLAVTIRRDGDTKEYQMVVAKAPEEFSRTRFEMSGSFRDSLVPGGLAFVGGLPRGGVGAVRASTGGVPAGGAGMRLGPDASPVVVAPRMPTTIIFPRPVDGVWGAQLATIEGGLARALGVKSGVLVTAVAQATPASNSGLESGDIIVRVDGHPLLSVDELRRAAVDHRLDHAVELQIQRAKKLKSVTVRWPL